MLSKLFARVAARKFVAAAPRTALVQAQVRLFRTDFVNPYLKSPIDLSETERTKQEQLPVWDRTFDY
jgi:hypothetical protein